MASYREIAVNGLWKNNPGLVQLLGLCPLLGVSNSMVNALGMGIATALVLAASNAAVALIRRQVTDAVRLPVFVMIIAALTTCIELLMQAFTYELYQILGIFIPLITTNCTKNSRAVGDVGRHREAFDGCPVFEPDGLKFNHRYEACCPRRPCSPCVRCGCSIVE